MSWSLIAPYLYHQVELGNMTKEKADEQLESIIEEDLRWNKFDEVTMIDEINKIIEGFEKLGYSHEEAVNIVEKACNLSDKELKSFKKFSDEILLDKNWYFLKNLDKCEPPPIKIVFEGDIAVERNGYDIEVRKKFDCSYMSDEEFEDLKERLKEQYEETDND